MTYVHQSLIDTMIGLANLEDHLKTGFAPYLKVIRYSKPTTV
jgi:hypothetical protein